MSFENANFRTVLILMFISRSDGFVGSHGFLCRSDWVFIPLGSRSHKFPISLVYHRDRWSRFCPPACKTLKLALFDLQYYSGTMNEWILCIVFVRGSVCNGLKLLLRSDHSLWSSCRCPVVLRQPVKSAQSAQPEVTTTETVRRVQILYVTKHVEIKI